MNDKEFLRCRQAQGFFVRRDEDVTTQQYSVFVATAQAAIVVISPVEADDPSARLVLVHRDRGGIARVIGFTSEDSLYPRAGYFFEGELLPGKLFLIPVVDRCPTSIRHWYEDFVRILEEVDGCVEYTRRAEEAIEFLFRMLDADGNGYLSAKEMSVFKRFLGFGIKVTQDEWSDALCLKRMIKMLAVGWREGDLDRTFTEMSENFFKKFVLRLCKGEFVFDFGTSNVKDWQVLHETPLKNDFRARRVKYLETVFEKMGFDKNLAPCNITRYSIQIYTKRNLLSELSIVNHEKVSIDTAVHHVTRLFGKKWKKDELEVHTLLQRNWFSVAVKNCSDIPRNAKIDCSGTVGVVPSSSRLIWETDIPRKGRVMALRLTGDETFRVQCVLFYEKNGCEKKVNLLD